jgi:biopolymer transport protein ExbD
MIDVVFQLLIYFIVTIKPMDVFAHLDVNRPSPESKKEQMKTPPKMIRIGIYAEGFSINERPVTEDYLDGFIKEMGDLDRTQTVLIMCSGFSPHEKLIRVLDLCAKYKMTSLSVISTN